MRRGEGWNARLRSAACRSGPVWVEPQGFLRQRVAGGEAPRGLAQARVRVSRVLWLVSGEAEPVQREAAGCEVESAGPGQERQEPARVEQVRVPVASGQGPATA